MGVYIKGISMPKCCAECDAEGHYEDSYGDEYGFFCPFGYKAYTSETRELKRLDDCPLVPVPPHGRLIDADALMKTCGMAMDCYDCPNGEHGWCKRSQDAANICEAIEDAPTVIPVSKEGE